MRSRSVLAIATTAAILVGACSAGAPIGSDSPTTPTSATSPSAAAKRLKIGFVVHVKGNPFIKSIVAAAQDAANDLDVELVAVGPEGYDPEDQLKFVQDLIAAGADGVATSIPGVSMAGPLNQMVADGHPIVMFNTYATNVTAPFVGEISIPSWSKVGEAVATKLGASATGDVILGICSPQEPILVQRGKGVIKGLAAVAPGLKAQGPFLVEPDPVINLQKWEALAAANPTAKAFVGLCAQDPESLGKVNAQNDGRFVMAGGDYTPGNFQAVADGQVLMLVGQGAYVQGYLSVKMLVEHIRTGAPLTAGAISAGADVLTGEGGLQADHNLPSLTFAEFQATENDPAKRKAYYAPLFADGGIMSTGQWSKLIQPMSVLE